MINNPGTKDVSPLIDLNAVKNAVKNLILTNHGDRPFRPDIGSNVAKLLFEPADEFTAATLKDEIKLCVERFEPRINEVSVLILNNAERNSYQVTIGFNVIASTQRKEIAFYLERLR